MADDEKPAASSADSGAESSTTKKQAFNIVSANEDVTMTDADPESAAAVSADKESSTKEESKNENNNDNDNNIPMTTVAAPTATKSAGKVAKKSSRTASPVVSDLPTAAGGAATSAVAATLSASAAAAASASQAIAAANLAAAVQMAASLQLNGLLSLLTQSSSPGAASAADPTVLQTNNLVNTTASLSLSSANTSVGWQIPTPDQVRQAALKAVQESPPFCHLSKTDSAPQLKILVESDRLIVKGGMRGYRMARASHGVSQGCYYFEVLVLPPPSIHEIVASLPANARLGPSLQKQIQQAVEYEKQHPQQQSQQQHSVTSAEESTQKEGGLVTGDAAAGKKRKGDISSTEPPHKKTKSESGTTTHSVPPPPPEVGGHLRIGWSMRTGDLQAPVGYDKWSYGYRSISGSKIHQSRREDNWGGEPWGPGDIVGCAIYLTGNTNTSSTSSNNPGATTNTAGAAGGGAGGNNPSSNATGSSAGTGGAGNPNMINHIRFFKNGVNMGHFVITKGKREGGGAFEDIQPGTYYPAISSYLGGACQANFGPHFIYPPRKLPHGMAKQTLQPMSAVQPPPLSKEEIMARLKKKPIFSKVHAKEKDTPDVKMAAFREAVVAESQVLHDAYQAHRKKHLKFVIEARRARNLNVTELEQELEQLVKATSSDVVKAEATADEAPTAKDGPASGENVDAGAITEVAKT